MPRLALTLLLATLASAAHAQFDIEESHTTASLRGVSNTGGGAVWASGTNGTVLRSEDGGYLWQTCNTPPGAEKLDFRGIQAFDENTAIVMSSGPGDQSRLYKTTDGCQTWKLLFTNPDKDGFWDALQFTDRRNGYLLGDPVKIGNSDQRVFAYFKTADGGHTWIPMDRASMTYFIYPDTAIFAASNSSMMIRNAAIIFVTGGSHVNLTFGAKAIVWDPALSPPDKQPYVRLRLPLAGGESAGAFSIARRGEPDGSGHFVIVGGDYSKPGTGASVIAYQPTLLVRVAAKPAQTPPHGYRSAVAYDPTQKLWITVGPNGTDISTDDGRNWQPLGPSPTDPPDADKNWNALSLPFVVGPNGRIGRLRTITPPTPKKP